jgi:lipid A disaccharide synthetase
MVAPLEGVLAWITRPPLLGPSLRRLLIVYHKRRHTYLALPNMQARQRIMPELSGDVTPAEVADESARLLQDEGARRRLAEALAVIPRTVGGARAIVDAIAPRAGARVSPQ